MIRQTGLFLIFSAIIFPIGINQSEALLQLASPMEYELHLGESQTLQWGFISEDDFPVILELRAEKRGSELLSFPETVKLGPGERVVVNYTVTVPADYLDNVELHPALYALQRGELVGAGIINVQMKKIITIKIGDNPVPLPPEVEAVTPEPEQEKILEPGQEKTVEVSEAPKSLQIEIPAEEEAPKSLQIETPAEEEGGGCLIATATYGSEMSQQVQMLREIRDAKLLTTSSGSSFITGFNQFYYTFSPTIADWERQNPVFKEVVKIAITPLITSLSILNYVDMDSEAKVLGYGIGVILMNIGMYFVAPALLIMRLRR